MPDDSIPLTYDTRSVPQDIWDCVLDNFTEICHLEKCSLACRSWLHPARTRLFRDFRLDDDCFPGLDTLLQESATSPIGSMGWYIRHLFISMSAEVANPEALQILVHFKRVTELTLVGFDSGDCVPAVISRLRSLVDVEVLHVHYWELSNPDALRCIIRAFPALLKVDLLQVLLSDDAYLKSHMDNQTSRIVPPSTPVTPGPLVLQDVILDSQPLPYRPTKLSNVFHLLGPPIFSAFPPKLTISLHRGAVSSQGSEVKVNDILRAAGADLERLTIALREPLDVRDRRWVGTRRKHISARTLRSASLHAS